MILDREDLIEALKEAINQEARACKFYEHLFERAYSEEAKNAFEELRNQENSHLNYLCRVMELLNSSDGVITYREFLENPVECVTHPEPPAEEEEALKETFVDDTEAIMEALQLESRKYNLYAELAEEVKESLLSGVFQELKAEEDRHLKDLRRLKMLVES